MSLWQRLRVAASKLCLFEAKKFKLQCQFITLSLDEGNFLSQMVWLGKDLVDC